MELTEIADMYFRFVMNKPGKARSTEEGRWRLHIAPVLGTKQVHLIDARDILQLKNSLIEKKLSPQSIYHCLSLTRRLMKRAIEWKYLEGPLPNFHMPKFDNRRMRYLTAKEATQLLLVLKEKSELWHDIVVFALNTGMRAGEIFSLRPYDFSKHDRTIKVYDPKNTHTRVIPLNTNAFNIIEKHYNQYNETIFVGKDNKPIKQTRPFSKAVEQCGLNNGITDLREKVCFHTLRHTFASLLVQSGVSLSVVGSLLGHKQPRMTMRYAHLSLKQELDAVKVLNGILEEASTVT